MRYSMMRVLLLLCFVGAGSEVYGQNRDACDLVNKSDLEAILGQSLHVNSQNPQSCAYSNVDPNDPKDYGRLSNALGEQIRQEGQDVTYIVSENRAKYRIIQHCKAMNDPNPFFITFLTPAEVSAMQGAAGAAKIKADVNACIDEYDAKEISANRKAVIEYCFQGNDYTKSSNSVIHFDACMNRYDMLQAMCRRQLELQEAYSRRKNPGQMRASPRCPGVRVSPRELLVVRALPAVRGMEELPSKFSAPPNVVVPPGAQLSIPAGTVLDTRLTGGLYAINVEAGQYMAVRLEQALVVGGLTMLPANTHITLKTRIVGPGTGSETVQIGLTTDQAAMPGGKYADVTCNELLFTVTKDPSALEGGGIPFDTKLRFTIGTSALAATPAAPPTAAAPPSVPAPPEKRLDVVIAVNYLASPNPAAVEQFQKRIDETTYEVPIAVPDLSDAAFWIVHMPGTSGAALSVFSGGKTTLSISGDITLDQAKAVAAKALGTVTKTGFAYGTPSPFKKPVLGPRSAKPSQIEQLKFDLTAKAEKGSAKAQFALANFYENGIIGPDGIPKPDYPAAAYWYQEASDRGEPAGSFALGQLYRDGRGMAPDPVAALGLFRKAAMADFVPAMVPLAYSYGVVKMETSLQRAQIWARKASDAGDPEAHLFMGYLWNKGYLSPPRSNLDYAYQEAMKEYLKAAEGGDCVAMMNIGGLYFNGDGVTQDKNQAQSWFGKAKTCSGSDLDWMRDKAAKYQKRAANGQLPSMPQPPPGADLVKLGNSLISMMSMTLGVDVLAADSEETLANLSLGEILGRAQKNRKSACIHSGLATNLGMSPSVC